MSDFTFELEGLEELQRDIDQVFRVYPEAASKKVYNLAGKFTKDVNAKFPASYSTGKRPIPKSWKREREKAAFTGYTVSVEVRNTSPHFHLVENGHEGKIPENGYAAHKNSKGQAAKAGSGNKKLGKRKKNRSRMKVIGFVPGKHYCEATRREWQEKFPEEVRKFVDKMLKDKRL